MSVFVVPYYAALPQTLTLSNATADTLSDLVIFRRGNSGRIKLFKQEGYEHLTNFTFPTRNTTIYLHYVTNMSKAKLYINLGQTQDHQKRYLTYVMKELILCWEVHDGDKSIQQ